MKRKLIAFGLCLIMAFSISTIAYAASFPDVTVQNWSWAINEIEAMADQGIISGYPDGTFKPANGVTKIQSLLLTSRILGITDERYDKVCALALSEYSDVLSKYNIDYKKEVAFLLHRGFLKTSELDTYISDANKDTVLKRYEAAILITKTLNAEQRMADEDIPVAAYSDQSQIPAAARKYVDYVSYKGIMQGVSATEFSPQTDVNRAQMAVMLKKSMDTMGLSFVSGKLTTVTPSASLMTVMPDGTSDSVRYSLDKYSTVFFNGEKINYYDIPLGSSVLMAVNGETIVSCDAFSPEVDSTVFGVVKNTDYSGEFLKINVYNAIEGADKAVAYPLAADCVLLKNGVKIELNAVQKEDYVKLMLKDGYVVSLEVMEKEETINGTITNLDLANNTFTLQTNSGEESVFYAYDTVLVYRNSIKTSISDVYVGDSVKASLSYGCIQRLDIIAKDATTEGLIEEIVISKTPSITIRSGGESAKYSLSNDVVVIVGGEQKKIFDLRLDNNVKLTITGGVVTKIETQTVAETQTVSGIITAVNAARECISVTMDGTGEERQVFMATRVSIVNNAGQSLAFRDLKEGMSVICTGSINNVGLFESIVIVVLG